jgi:hypothetical protein
MLLVTCSSLLSGRVLRVQKYTELNYIRLNKHLHGAELVSLQKLKVV